MKHEEYERMYRFEDSYWWFVARRNLIAALLADLRPHASPLKILDIGCGTGAMLDVLAPYGKVVGADFSPEALSFCRSRGERNGNEYNLVRADVRRLPFAENQFDVVTAMDIIEHIDRDKDALLEICRVLAPGGRLFATVPAFASLWSEHDEALHHYRRYRALEFKDVVQRAGLTVEKTSYTLTALFPLVWLFRQAANAARRIRNGHQPQAHLVRFPQPINSALLSLVKAETQIVRRMNLPFGVTVVLVARKGEPAGCRSAEDSGR
jgi:ubiquinone/menaquinone biosynthesis C-methylase UbiE